jgi:hypothetical protein
MTIEHTAEGDSLRLRHRGLTVTNNRAGQQTSYEWFWISVPIAGSCALKQ